MPLLVVTAMGPDRPGLVDQLTQVAADHGGNVADSRMVNLHGVFALVMLIEPRHDPAALQDALEHAAQRLDLTLNARHAGSTAQPRPAVPYRIRVYAMDQVGLVHRITHALHVLDVNIEELSTRLEHAPHTGAPLFSMDLTVALPADIKLKTLRHNLEELCAELNCDLDIDRV